jgi:hypothetical protein
VYGLPACIAVGAPVINSLLQVTVNGLLCAERPSVYMVNSQVCYQMQDFAFKFSKIFHGYRPTHMAGGGYNRIMPSIIFL